MSTRPRDNGRRWSRAVPTGLAVAMLAVVVLAGLLPDTGAVAAASNCTYGSCPASQPFPVWAIGASIAAVLLALVIALLLFRRARRPPPPDSTPSEEGPTEAPTEDVPPEEGPADAPPDEYAGDGGSPP